LRVVTLDDANVGAVGVSVRARRGFGVAGLATLVLLIVPAIWLFTGGFADYLGSFLTDATASDNAVDQVAGVFVALVVIAFVASVRVNQRIRRSISASSAIVVRFARSAQRIARYEPSEPIASSGRSRCLRPTRAAARSSWAARTSFRRWPTGARAARTWERLSTLLDGDDVLAYAGT
jgi:hypothetical protein